MKGTSGTPVWDTNGDVNENRNLREEYADILDCITMMDDFNNTSGDNDKEDCSSYPAAADDGKVGNIDGVDALEKD